MSISIQGLAKAGAQIAAYQKNKRININKIIKETAGKVEQSQKQKVARLSSETHDSIKQTWNDDGSVRIGPEGPKGFRANWIEHGTVNHPAQPFVRPSMDENMDMIKKVEKEVKRL